MLDRAWEFASDLAPLAAPLLAVADVVGANEMPWGSLSATSLLGWYLWYNTSRGIPALVDKHSETVARINEQYLALLEKQSKEHAEDMQRIDTIRRDEQARFLEAIGSLNRTIQGLSCQTRPVIEG